MTLEQARKMRDGVLKGDSAIAKAWKELISGEPSAIPSDTSPQEGSPDTAKERREKGISALVTEEEDTEGW